MIHFEFHKNNKEEEEFQKQRRIDTFQVFLFIQIVFMIHVAIHTYLKRKEYDTSDTPVYIWYMFLRKCELTSSQLIH